METTTPGTALILHPHPVREWSTVNKTEWGAGEWSAEPDKVQYLDEATGYDVLLVRNPRGGHWCGYVGVLEGHPAFGLDYDKLYEVTEVHGGLTYSDTCTEPTREMWEKWRAYMLRTVEEAQKFPRGDSAQNWRTEGHLVDDYDAWCEMMAATSICHRPYAGRPGHVWWLGFDCAHCNDLSPGHERVMEDVLGGEYRGPHRFGHSTYKTREYVEAQCRELAQQLRAVQVSGVVPSARAWYEEAPTPEE